MSMMRTPWRGPVIARPRFCVVLPGSCRLLEIHEAMVRIGSPAEKYFRYVNRYIGCIGWHRGDDTGDRRLPVHQAIPAWPPCNAQWGRSAEPGLAVLLELALPGESKMSWKCAGLDTSMFSSQQNCPAGGGSAYPRQESLVETDIRPARAVSPLLLCCGRSCASHPRTGRQSHLPQPPAFRRGNSTSDCWPTAYPISCLPRNPMAGSTTATSAGLPIPDLRLSKPNSGLGRLSSIRMICKAPANAGEAPMQAGANMNSNFA